MRALVRKHFTKHGYTPASGWHPLYVLWRSMKKRCYCSNNKDFSRYGGRGIVLCDEWVHDPAAFIRWALAQGWRRGLQIDRIDNDGPYSPANCRYTTGKQNCRNRRDNRYLTALGETKTVADWGDDERARAPVRIIYHRVHVYGWDAERAITTPNTAWRNRGRKGVIPCES